MFNNFKEVLIFFKYANNEMTHGIGLNDLKTATQTDPFTGLSLDRKLTDEELARAIRLDLEAELDAINLYSSHLEATDHEEAKKVLEHVIKEEKDHHALFTGLINKLDPEQAETKDYDIEEVKEGSKKQAGGLEDFIVNWDATKEFRVKALEYAELRPETYDVTKWADLPKHIQRYIYLKFINVYTSVKKISKVVQKSDGWHVLSEKGKNLGGPYKTKAEAVKRLRAAEFFKHKGQPIKHPKESITVNPQQTQQSYSLDSIIGCDEDEEKKPIGLKDVIKKYEKDSIFKLGASTDWLRELWKREADKVMRELADKNPEFAEEYSTKHIPLYEEYTTHDLKRVTTPFMEGSIDKDQAEKLLRDLMYQFREKLYIDHGLSHAEVVKDKEKDEMQMDLEKESYTERDLPAFGSANQYPYSGTGAGMPSSSDLSRIINDVPSRNVIIK